MKSSDIYILGVGHNTVVYIDLLEACGYKIAGLYHYNSDFVGKEDHGYGIIGCYDDLWNMPTLEGMNFALSQGDNKIRKDLFDKIISRGGNIPTLIHPSANVSRFAKLGMGTVVHINTIVHPDCVIGDNTVLSYNVSVSHSSSIGKNCYVAFGALIGAYVNIEDEVFIGIGANIISGKVDNIGSHAYVGAGALVTKSVLEYTVVAGSPAKVIKTVNRNG